MDYISISNGQGILDCTVLFPLLHRETPLVAEPCSDLVATADPKIAPPLKIESFLVSQPDKGQTTETLVRIIPQIDGLLTINSLAK